MGLLIADFSAFLLVLFFVTQVLLPYAFPTAFSSYFWLFRKSKEIPVKVEDLVHQKEDLAKTAKTVIEQANEEAEHAATVKKQAEELLK